MAELADPDLSTPQRMQWLRDRGVQIALSSKDSQSDTPAPPSDEAMDEAMESLCVVMVPANEKEPCEEIHLRISKKSAGDQLVTALKSIFSTNETVDTALVKESASKQFGNMDVKVSESAIQRVAQEGNVEMFSLARPHASNEYTGVSIYLDEAGALKSLPRNSRATGIANLCGFKNVPFLGDVFIGRLKVSPGSMKNIDFRLSEMDSGADWLKGVEKQNYDFGVATNAVTMSSDEGASSGGLDVEKGYSWTEDEGSVEMTVTVPEHIKSAKELNVKISSASIKISAKSGGWALELNLHGKIAPDDCTWTFGSGSVELTLEKAKSGIWRNLISD